MKKKKKKTTMPKKKKKLSQKATPQTKLKILEKTLEYEPLKEIYVNVLS